MPAKFGKHFFLNSMYLDIDVSLHFVFAEKMTKYIIYYSYRCIRLIV